jgi:NAD(P)-dependent dehydrogenase (short-subunit alcohol dehydrogenase family)
MPARKPSASAWQRRAAMAAAQRQRAGSIEALIDAVVKEFGGISILVNNAGITRDNLLMRMKDEDWQAILDTNLTSVYPHRRR